ncbi:MAG: hypothetical protein WKG00_12565 [Polyangiaceae bacterium]
MAILKRIRHLNGAAQRRVILQRAGAVVVATAAVALVTAGVTRWLRAPAPTPTPARPRRSSQGPSRRCSRCSTCPAEVGPSVPVPSARPRTAPPGPSTGPGPSAVASGAPGVGPAKGPRPGRVAIKQAGARLEVDGREQRGWFGKSIPLDVGPHTATASIDNPCCEPTRSVTFTVAPPAPDEPSEKPQVVQVSLAFKKSTVSLQARDSTHQMTCNDGPTVFGGGSQIVTLNDVSQTFRCTFRSPDGTTKPGTVTVHAGKDQVVRWPE